jgi:hypothetical protein
MRVRGLAGTALMIVALAVGGCTATDDTPAPEPTGAVVDDPAAHDALTKAMAFISTTSYETYLNMGPTVEAAGYMDVPHKAAQLATVLTSGDQKTTVQVRLVGGGIYLKIDGKNAAGLGDKWAKLDPKKITKASLMDFTDGRNDPSGGARILAAATAVEQTPTGFRGTIDFTKAGKGSGISLRPEQLAALDNGGTAVPFTANIDAQGHVVLLRLTLAAGADSLPVQVRYSNFGQSTDVEQPTGTTVVVAPASLYTTLGL